MSLSAVAIDRYVVISRPLDLAKKPTRTHAYISVLLIWIYSAVFASMPLLGFGKYVPEGYLTSCSFDYLSDDVGTRIFILVFFFGAWLIPMIINVCSYVSIIRAVVHVRRGVAHTPTITDPNLPASNRKRNSVGMNHINNQYYIHYGLLFRLYVLYIIGINQPDVETKVAKIVMGLIGAWTVSWTPYAFVALMGISGHGHLLTVNNF